MNSFLNGESLAVRTPLDENAVVVVDVAPETLVLLGVEVLRVPDEDSSILGAACQMFTIGTQIQVFIIEIRNQSTLDINISDQITYPELDHCGPSG